MYIYKSRLYIHNTYTYIYINPLNRLFNRLIDIHLGLHYFPLQYIWCLFTGPVPWATRRERVRVLWTYPYRGYVVPAGQESWLSNNGKNFCALSLQMKLQAVAISLPELSHLYRCGACCPPQFGGRLQFQPGCYVVFLGLIALLPLWRWLYYLRCAHQEQTWLWCLQLRNKRCLLVPRQLLRTECLRAYGFCYWYGVPCWLPFFRPFWLQYIYSLHIL